MKRKCSWCKEPVKMQPGGEPVECPECGDLVKPRVYYCLPHNLESTRADFRPELVKYLPCVSSFKLFGDATRCDRCWKPSDRITKLYAFAFAFYFGDDATRYHLTTVPRHFCPKCLPARFRHLHGLTIDAHGNIIEGQT